MTNHAKGEIVCEYIRKYPTIQKLTLARLIFKERPEAFRDVEDCRSVIRYYTGANGKASLKRVLGGANADLIGLNQLPPSEKEEREDFILPKVNNNCLVIGDTHIPYQDNQAIDACLNWAVEKRVNTILMIGDIMDFYRLSKFVQDPRKRDFQFELDCGYEFISHVRNALPRVKIFYLPGNHEYRLERYWMIKAPELLGVTDYRMDDLLHFSDFSVTYLRHSQLIQAGDLWIGHGDEFKTRSNPVSPARTFALKGKINYLGGHWHITSEFSWRRADGKVEGCWSMGGLCGLYPEYRPYNDWNHGFAHVRINPDGTFRIFNAKIENGKVQ